MVCSDMLVDAVQVLDRTVCYTILWPPRGVGRPMPTGRVPGPSALPVQGHGSSTAHERLVGQDFGKGRRDALHTRFGTKNTRVRKSECPSVVSRASQVKTTYGKDSNAR